MKGNQRSFCIEYNTAPTMLDPANCEQMSSIQLELPKDGPRDATKMYRRLLTEQIHGDGQGDFREWWSRYLRGKFPESEPLEWLLWHVRIVPQQLQLMFSRRDPIVEPRGSNPLSGSANLNVARVLVTAPERLVCDFTVPPVLDEPKKTVRYDFVRCNEVAENPPQWCHLRVTEIGPDKAVMMRYSLKTPFAGVCDPGPTNCEATNPPNPVSKSPA